MDYCKKNLHLMCNFFTNCRMNNYKKVLLGKFSIKNNPEKNETLMEEK